MADLVKEQEESLLRDEHSQYPSLETSPSELEHFFSGPVWRDMQLILQEAADEGANQLSDLDLTDQATIEQWRGRLYQIKWWKDGLKEYMIGVAEGLTPE